ncbi:hypothetical protein TREMEDRAFT_57375 [Tremella mesenterica DSM 1558]|uniref:uncharacterized protein n=1 Tax=Tremella mesenterica (strain ATCC 24925 / CBS 8224 / DSM 1558 / NBRC 9311 / NRRL Y-6157 / RJB 2259-6 / UBC 559-6) TaxID=578456 RepID=UPI0003F4A094|nr:uncharacterized protein TREMEDRAFT_57375 [Tremella mesenterica DSM 1558]EIW67874.1 hypothetical protein TREMEDRAFT_57375 [Tremella mesenterica DSM 1558]
MILFGLALALLGLLDLGPREVSFLSQTENNTTAGSDKVTDSLNPMYRLLSTRYPLLVIWLTYFGVYMGSIAVLGFVHRRKGGVWDEDVGGEEKKLGGGIQVDERGDEEV